MYPSGVASRPARVFAALCAIAVLVGFGVSGAHGTERATAGTACPTRCDGGGLIVLHGSHDPAPTTCLHDAGCGGGGALTSSVTPVVAVFTAVGLALAVFALWARRSARRVQPVGVLLATSLFRPPRPAFDI